MCERGKTVMLWHPAIGNYDVDECLTRLVDALNNVGIRTVASCCGHGHRPSNIILEDGREVIIARDYEEGRYIDSFFPIDINGEEVGSDGS